MLVTSLVHVNGAALPSSKNDRGSVAACVGADVGLVNEVVDVVEFTVPDEGEDDGDVGPSV